MELRFALLPKLPFGSRMVLIVGLALLGFLSQFYVPWVLGCLPLLAAGILFAAKGFSNKPKDLGLEEWRAVSSTEIDRITDNLRASKRIRLPAYFTPAAGSIILVIGLGLSFFSGMIGASFHITIINGLCLATPIFFSGMVSVWVPADLKMKMEAFQAILSQEPDPELILTPYLRFDKDKEGRQIPEDVRLMVERRRMPEGFIGIQIQAAINNGESGAVPYLYAVCLTRGRPAVFEKLSSLKVPGYEVEWKKPKEYGAVVIRQKTSGDGYHTKPKDCARLYSICQKILHDQEVV